MRGAKIDADGCSVTFKKIGLIVYKYARNLGPIVGGMWAECGRI